VPRRPVAELTDAVHHAAPPAGLVGLEHPQHAIGDQKAADDVGRGREQGNRAENADAQRVVAAGDENGADHGNREIALVSDMSGVWSSRETRRMTPSPMNVASTNT
jgi:hypothetical protein